MKPACRKCDCAEMRAIDENRRQLIAEVIEIHYRCPECGYELIIPEPVEE